MSNYRQTDNNTLAMLNRLSNVGNSGNNSSKANKNSKQSFAGSVHRVTSEVLKIGQNGQLYDVSGKKKSGSSSFSSRQMSGSSHGNISRWNPGGTLKASRLTSSLGIRSMNNGSGGTSRTVTPYMLSGGGVKSSYDNIRRQQHRPHSAQLISSRNRGVSRSYSSSSSGSKKRPSSSSNHRSSLRRNFSTGHKNNSKSNRNINSSSYDNNNNNNNNSSSRRSDYRVVGNSNSSSDSHKGINNGKEIISTSQPITGWRLRQKQLQNQARSIDAEEGKKNMQAHRNNHPPLPSGTINNNGSSSKRNNNSDMIPAPSIKETKKSAFIDASDTCVFAVRNGDDSGQQVVYRTPEQKQKNPERLNLDRRQLTRCPILENEIKLRLLNYQNNKLSSIACLEGLPNLIFLDLYNNKINEIRNLDVVPTLRVLMLGKNKIKNIEHLDKLTKLDVLDLHSNQISTVENLNHLAELRVLNLAGNHLKSVERLKGLRSLTELNVRRNEINECFELDQLPALQRVFLSNNRVSHLEAISCLFRSKTLTELAMDGNPVVNVDKYRPHLILRIRTLRNLDLKRVTEEERRRVSELFKAEENSRAEERRQQKVEQERLDAIKNVEKKWEAEMETLNNNTNRDESTTGELKNNIKKDSSSSDTNKKSKRNNIYSSTSGYSEVEVEGLVKRLCIYGPGFSVLTNSKIQAAVEEIKITYVNFDVASDTFNKFNSFNKVRKVIFNNTNLKTLKQIAKFRLLPTSITEIDVEKNPINDLMLLRAFVAHRLPHINSINGVTIADSERYRASRIFSKASHITQKTKENGLFANINQERYKQVSENYTTSIVNHAVRIEERLTQLNETWPEIVNKIVKDTMIGLDSVAMFSSMSFNK